MAQGDFFSNLKNAQQDLEDARKRGLITAQQEEDHMMKMISYYEAINAKKAKQYDFDSSQCELTMAQQYGSPITTPANYFQSCMKAQGWHF